MRQTNNIRTNSPAFVGLFSIIGRRHAQFVMLPRDSYLSASIANISTLQPKLVHFSSCNVVIPTQELPNCGANALGSRQFLLPAHSVNTPGFQTMHKDVRPWVISFTIFYSRVLSLSSMLVHVPFFELRYTLSLKVGLKQ